ncbi:hypothetical protein D9Q98_001438 [Chlorella vulgaris]|uniref:PPM-type phosphatase domain-containing protein n=1 Tax=Chlorella vulgaris TaxID=3077 RepID=A0A9D4Z390_CHLVU|nr:hypothetical protein D9Q98_001438 [Chlorella vulgaris]
MIALFEGLGDDRHSVAAFCRGKVFELFQHSSVCHPDSPLDALQATVDGLDAAIFATSKLSQSTKANSGAACVLLVLEHGGQRVYCASLGAAQCLLSRIAGSFNAKAPEGFFLSAEHTTSNKEELVRLQKRSSAEATPPGAAARSGGAGQQGSVTRALGFTEAKRQAGGSRVLLCEAHVAEHTLSSPDQHLVLGSSAFWQLVGPTDCALRAHFHEKFALQSVEQAAAHAAAAEAAGVPEPPTPSVAHAANTAAHLVHWALEKACRKLARLQRAAGNNSMSSGSLPPSVADLMALPLSSTARPGPAAAATRPGPAAAASSVLGSAGQELPGAAAEGHSAPQQQSRLVRSDVHGDLGVVVVTLRRTDQSVDGGMRQLLVAAAARAGAAAAGQAPPGGGYLERTAQRRWDMLRMLVDFQKAHRRVLLRRWWEAQEALFRRSRIAGGGGSRIHLFASSPSKLASAAAARGAALQLGCSPSKIPLPPPPQPAAMARRRGDGGIKALRVASE